MIEKLIHSLFFIFDFIFSLIPWVFYLIASGLVLGAAAFAIRNLRRLFSWSSAEGLVHRIDDAIGRQGRRMFRPAVRFSTRDGREFSFLSEVSTSHQGYEVGDAVRVLYDPRDPERAEIRSFLRQWFPVVILSIMAGGIFYLIRGG